MTELLNYIVRMIAILNNRVVAYLNQTLKIYDDKTLHFIVIGGFGIILFLLIKPLFKFLSKKNAVITITFIYVFTLLVVISFAIEIGQGITGTGAMDLKDVEAGLVGFFSLFLAYVVIYYSIKAIIDKVNERKNQVNN